MSLSDSFPGRRALRFRVGDPETLSREERQLGVTWFILL